MPEFRKKPVVIEARQFDGPDIFEKTYEAVAPASVPLNQRGGTPLSKGASSERFPMPASAPVGPAASRNVTERTDSGKP